MSETPAPSDITVEVEQFALGADGVYKSLGKHDSLGKQDVGITSAVATDVTIDLTKVW